MPQPEDYFGISNRSKTVAEIVEAASRIFAASI